MAQFFKAQPKAKSTGRIISLRIDKLDNNCVGIGYNKRKPVFVSGVLVGEQVSAKIIDEKSKYVIAQLIDIEQPSNKRIAAPCQHFLTCGGCDIQHIQYSEHVDIKSAKVTEYFSRQGITVELPWQPPISYSDYAYRRKARIGVQYNKAGQATVGFRKKSSNTLTAIKECLVLDERIRAIFRPLNELIAKLSLNKSIGHIEVIATEHISLVVRQLVNLNAQDKKRWQAFSEQHQWQVYFDNGKKLIPLDAALEKPLSYRLFDGTTIDFSASNFIQVNASVNNQMIAQAMQWLALTKDDNVLDLFCGLGNFSLPIAKKVSSVTGVEGVQDMVDGASYNAQKNGITNCVFYQANINSTWDTTKWRHQHFNKVILDPARAGALEALPQVFKLNVDIILYVSCDAASLARDSQLIVNQGYQIKKIAVMDMFSQTKHIETMVLFSLNHAV